MSVSYHKCYNCLNLYEVNEGLSAQIAGRTLNFCSINCMNEVHDTKWYTCFCDKTVSLYDCGINKDIPGIKNIVGCDGCKHVEAYYDQIKNAHECDFCKEKVFEFKVHQLTEGGPKRLMKVNMVTHQLEYIGLVNDSINNKVYKNFTFCSIDHLTRWRKKYKQDQRKGVIYQNKKYFQKEWFEKLYL